MASPVEKVVFSWRDEPGRTCELMGDFPDWQYPVPMPEVAPGLYRCELGLTPGVYRYKLRVDYRRWHRDPSEDAADTVEGFDNSLRIVGGTTPPVFFAPDRRHLAVDEHGRLQIQMEVEVEVEADATCNDPLRVSVVDERGEVPVALREILRAGGRVMVAGEAQTRASPARLWIAGPSPTNFPLPAPRSAEARPPAWLQGSVLYAIFVDRWHRSPASSPDPRAASRHAPSTPDTYYCGDLAGIREALAYFAYLGVDALVLTPIQLSETPHRYDGHDLMRVDPRLGGEAAWGELIAAAHAQGLRIIADASVTHVNEAHPAFQDLLQHQARSAFASWFWVERFPVRARDASTVRLYLPHLPRLRLEPGPAREHALAAVCRLVVQGVDGLRLDAMNDAPPDFWCELRQRVRRLNPELLLLGETVSDRPARYAEAAGVDVATDFAHRDLMIAAFAHDRIDAQELWRRSSLYRFRTGPLDPSFHLSFLDNHDTARFRSDQMPYDRLRLALTYLLTRPETVWLTYGTELNLGGCGQHFDLDDAWPDRRPMPEIRFDAGQTQALTRQLIALRHEHPALRRGDLRLVTAAGPLLAFDRSWDGQTVRVIINNGAEPQAVTVPPAAALLLAVNEPPGPVAATLGPRCARLVCF